MPDLIGPDVQRTGKGKLVRILACAITENPDFDAVVRSVDAAAQAHRKGEPLDDDVRFLVSRYVPVTAVASTADPERAAQITHHGKLHPSRCGPDASLV